MHGYGSGDPLRTELKSIITDCVEMNKNNKKEIDDFEQRMKVQQIRQDNFKVCSDFV